MTRDVVVPAVVCALTSAVIATAITTYGGLSHAQPQPMPLVATEFVVVDDRGVPRASLGVAPSGDVRLEMHGPDGTLRTTLSVQENGTHLAFLGTGTEGPPRLVLFALEGEDQLGGLNIGNRLLLQARPQQAFLAMPNPAAGLITLGVGGFDTPSPPYLTMFDFAGSRIEVGFDAQSPTIQLMDPQGPLWSAP